MRTGRKIGFTKKINPFVLLFCYGIRARLLTPIMVDGDVPTGKTRRRFHLMTSLPLTILDFQLLKFN